MAGFREALRDAVRQLSFRTSVDSLKKKGVRKVNVLGLDRIVALIEEAVHRSLKRHLYGIEREVVADATKAEFLRLLRSNEDLERQKSEIERQRELAEEEVDALRRELAANHQALRIRLQTDPVDFANRYQGEDAAIASKVRDVVRELSAADGTAPAAVEQRLMELVMDVVSGERAAAEAARRALQDREVDTLQRRIKKLSDTLSLTEHRLQQVSSQRSVDTGISSIYRTVQGLDAQDTQVDRKRELMAEIFRANLTLQKRGRGA